MTTFLGMTDDAAKAWLLNDLNTDDWNSVTIAGSLSEDILTIAVDLYAQLPFTVKKGLLFSILSIKPGDEYQFGTSIQQFVQKALNDSNDFIRCMAKVIEPFPNSLNLDIDIWCEDFKSSLQMIDETIRLRGLSFHSKEDMLMHPQARIVPAHAGSNYVNYSPSANEPYFSLLQNVDDEFSAKTRHSRFAELIDLEARLEARNPLQHRSSFGNALSAVPNASTGGPPGIRPHDRISPPATMPSVQRAPTMPGQRPPMQRRMPSNSNPASQSALYNKRAAKPIAGNLFTPKRPTVPHRQNSLIHGNNLPRGLQREKRVQMIDFDDATAMQQNAADALRKAKEDEKMEKLAKRQAALERKRQRDEEEKRAMDEAKEKKAAAKKKAKTTASKRKQSVTEIKTDTTTRSPTASAPASPQTPTSPSPKTPKLQKF